MSEEDRDYLEGRAVAEIELAQRSSHEKVVQAHYQLASAYLDLIHGDRPSSPPGPFQRSNPLP